MLNRRKPGVPGPVVVIGAGLSGLACANRLQWYGVASVVLEARNVIGGSWQSREIDGYLIDRGFRLISAAALCEVIDPIPFVAHLRTLDDEGVVLMPDGEGSSQGAATERTMQHPWDWFPLHLQPDVPWGVLVDAMLCGGDLGPDVRRHRPSVSALYASVTHDLTGTTSANHAARVASSVFPGGGVIAGGLGLLPTLLASGVDVRLGSRATSVQKSGQGWIVQTPTEIFEASMVVVALEPASANRLLGSDLVAPVGSASTFWFACDAPSASRRLHLGVAEPGRVVNSCVVSNIAPQRAPSGRGLVVATCLGEDVQESVVRSDLSTIYSVDTSAWRTLERQDFADLSLATGERGGPVSIDTGLMVVRAEPSLVAAISAGQTVGELVAARLGARTLRRQWALAKERVRWEKQWDDLNDD